MPQPTSSQVYIDAILSNIAIAYLQNQTDYIATKVFPVVPVDRQSGKYFLFDKNSFLRDQMERRAPSTESAGSGYTESTDSYLCDVFALHKDISDQVRANSQPPNDPDVNATQYLTQMALIKQEVQWTSDYFTTSVWATDKVGTTDFVKWTDYTSSTPLTDLRTGIRTIKINTGFTPNKLVLGYDVWNVLQDHPDLIDRLKVTDNKMMTTQALAALLRIDEVLVCNAVKATNNEGATGAYDFVQGKNALLCYAAPSPSIDTPSAGYTFMWSGVSHGMGLNAAIKNIPMPHLESDRLEIQMAWDNKVSATDLGYFYSAAVA